MFITMKTINNFKLSSRQFLACLCLFFITFFTAQAQSLDSLVVNFNEDFLEVLTNSAAEINPFQNDNCSDPDNPECPILLGSLYIADYTQPEHGELTLAGNYFIYTPNLDYEGFDEFYYDVESTVDGSLLVPLHVSIYVGPVLPAPIPPCGFGVSGTIPTCPIVPTVPCNLICNSSIGTNITDNPNNINSNTTPHWFPLRGTPNTSATDPFGINCGSMGMWATGPNCTNGEAAATRLNKTVSPGFTYLLTYTRRNFGSDPRPVDQLITRLDNFGAVTVNNFQCNPAAQIPAPYVIGTDPNILPGAPAQRVATWFTVPFGSNYNQLAIYPRQTTTIGQATIAFDQIELIEYSPGMSYAINVPCCQSYTLTAPCTGSGTTWQWWAVDIPSGNPTNVLQTGSTFTIDSICQPITVQLQLNVQADIINENASPITYVYSFTPVDCCCDDFVNSIVNSPIPTSVTGNTISFTTPGPILPGDVVQWDFNCDGIVDNTTTGQTTVQHTYPSPGACNYVACIKAMRVDAQGDTCWAIQTQFITIPENCESCLSFDGTNDFISVPGSASLLNGIGTGDFTFEAKIKAPANAGTTHRPIFSNRDGTGLNGTKFFIHTPWGTAVNNLLSVQIGGTNYFITDNGGNNGINLLDDVCHHVAIAKNGNTLYFYIDGVLIGTQVITIASIASSAEIQIADDIVVPPFMGNISDVRIWNTARSQTDIQSNMNSIPPTVAGLLANWPLHEGYGQNVTDMGTSAYHGILGTNNTVEVTDPSWGADCCSVCPQSGNGNGCECDQEFFDNVALGFTSFFNGLTGSFTPNGDFDNDCDHIIWQWGDGTIGSNTTGNQSVVHTFPANNVFNVCMIVQRFTPNGIVCSDTICNNINLVDNLALDCTSFESDVNDGFNISSSETNYTFTPISLTSGDYVEWNWGDDSPDGSSTGNNSVSHSFTDPGSYNVCMLVNRILSNDEPCSLSYNHCQEIDVVVSVIPESLNNAIKIYPTIMQERLMVEINNNNNVHASIQMFDIKGALVLQRNIGQNGTTAIDVSNLAKGMYFVQLVVDNKTIVQKVIKQ